MARCKGCIHDAVCNRDIGHGYSICPHFLNAADVVTRSEVAREILAELETKAPFFCENQIAYEHFNEELTELKKKYTEGEK